MAQARAARSLLDTLAVLPSGANIGTWTMDELGRHLREKYFSNQDEKDRMERHALRDELYQDGGVAEMHKLIDAVYLDPEVKRKRKQWARWARSDNLTKRLVNEQSTAYQEPAIRKVGGPDSNEANYQLAVEFPVGNRVMALAHARAH